jgi:hypothetical protein
MILMAFITRMTLRPFRPLAHLRGAGAVTMRAVPQDRQ